LLREDRRSLSYGLLRLSANALIPLNRLRGRHNTV